MPTYEYACDQCGHDFEQFQSISAARLLTCPECGEDALKRLIGKGGGIIFKGSGFYQTDYKNQPKGDNKEAATDKPAAAKDSSSTTAKTGGDAKPAQSASTPSSKPAAASA